MDLEITGKGLETLERIRMAVESMVEIQQRQVAAAELFEKERIRLISEDLEFRKSESAKANAEKEQFLQIMMRAGAGPGQPPLDQPIPRRRRGHTGDQG
jgi:hypothetical protein